jgi:hypothetical protein
LGWREGERKGWERGREGEGDDEKGEGCWRSLVEMGVEIGMVE